jgi:hypothetical protein
MAACARTSNIMKALSLSLALGVLTLAPLLAEEAKKLTPTEELLIVTRFEENGQEAAEASFKPFVEEFKKQGLPAEAILEIETAASAYFHQLMSDPELKQGVIDLSNEIFREEELIELLHFYQTPTVNKALMQMPKIFGDAMQLGQKHAKNYTPKFQTQIEAILKKHRGAEAATNNKKG